jgi:hypothetical protein
VAGLAVAVAVERGRIGWAQGWRGCRRRSVGGPGQHQWRVDDHGTVRAVWLVQLISESTLFSALCIWYLIAAGIRTPRSPMLSHTLWFDAAESTGRIIISAALRMRRR